jgi:ubiquinone/menaquinone biosynthesis C-methylase UbiE
VSQTAERQPAGPCGSIEPLRSIESSLACPACRRPLHLDGGELVGTACTHRYPIRDGIARLAVLGTAETWDGASTDADSKPYQQNYQQIAAAEDYNRGYQAKAFKRASTRRELSLLRSLLASQGRTRRLLNIPCGGGRLSRPLAESTDLLLEADIAVGQLLYGASRRDWTTPECRMTASAFHIPLCDRGVDAAVCIRLSHHLPSATERTRLLTELLRVADRFVVMTFFDFRSVKNWLRRARQPFDHKPPKHTMRVEEIAHIATQHGFTLRRCPPLSRLGSGHRYALLVRRSEAS